MFALTGVQYFFLFLAFYKKAYNGKEKVIEKKMVEKNNNVLDSKID